MQVEIKYQCQHLTCRIPRCHDGTLLLDKEKFDMYVQNCTEPGCFISPSNACKIGHTQVFKINEKKEIDNNVVQMTQRHEATIEEKKAITEKALENDRGPLPIVVPTAVAIDDRNLEEKYNVMVEAYNKITETCNELMNEQKQRVVALEKRVEKLEGWRKGSKVSRKEE